MTLLFTYIHLLQQKHWMCCGKLFLTASALQCPLQALRHKMQLVIWHLLLSRHLSVGDRKLKITKVSWAAKTHWFTWGAKAGPCGPTNRRATAALWIVEKVNAGSDGKESEHIACITVCWPVRVPVLTPIQQWAWEHQDWTKEQEKKVAWFDEWWFLLHHVDLYTLSWKLYSLMASFNRIMCHKAVAEFRVLTFGLQIDNSSSCFQWY